MRCAICIRIGFITPLSDRPNAECQRHRCQRSDIDTAADLLDCVVVRLHPGDAYPGTSNNRTFDATSNPSSESYSNATSCVAVTGISASGPSMTMQVQVKCPAGHAAPSQAAA